MPASGLGLGGERRYSVPSNPLMHDPRSMHSEDLHAWSIYRQNLNSDFTDSALGSTDKSPLPYGNFQLRDTTVQSILSHPRYGPKSALGSNMYTYLKFGLPRVFPPNHNGSQRSGTPKPKTSIGSGMKSVPRIQRQSRGVRETSSGYDSSDNETTANYQKYSRKYRSDPDFRMQNLHASYQPGTGVPLSALQQAGIRGDGHWTAARNKSISEANLLGIDRPRSQYNRRSSVAEYAPDNDHQSYLIPSGHAGGRLSKAGSHMSVAHSRKHSTLRHTDHLDGYTHSAYIYPNYYVNNLEVTSPDNKSMLLVSGLSFEVKSGEILAVLATAQHEATGLLDVLAGVQKKLSGDLVLNGQPVASSTLRKVCAYVRADCALSPALSVEHTLRFHAALRRPREHAAHKMDARERINLLIEELGLEQVRDTNVARLTRSEVRRLNVACQLLLDMAILILDQPTKEMDIFDTFFLVEYLRNWASTGRVVILSLHPPTYEIFAMLTKVVLVSAGRTMYSGYRRDMLPYFASIDYPCPAYKNPSDYYLDLVTLDSLSAAALLESSGRVEALAATLAQAQRAPEPPPPVPLPAPAPRAPAALPALLEKTLVFTQMTTLSNLVTRVLIAALMSLITGTIFWDLPSTDAKLTQNDRIGYHYSVMCLTLWPLLLFVSAREASSMRRYVERDIRVGLYSRTMFIVFDQFLELWSAGVTWLAFLVPSYAMSGLYAQAPADFDGFYLYLGYMLLYLISIQMLCRALIFLIPMEKTSSAISGILLLLTTVANGVMLHREDLPDYVKWLEYVSPSRWTLPELLQRELSEMALKSSISKEIRCTNKQRPYQDIIVQSPCPPPNGTQVLSNFDLLPSSNVYNWTDNGFLVALAVFYAVFALIGIVAFVADCTGYVRSKEKRALKGHKITINTP